MIYTIWLDPSVVTLTRGAPLQIITPENINTVMTSRLGHVTNMSCINRCQLAINMKRKIE